MTTSEDSAKVDVPVDPTPTLRERLAGKHAGPAREDEPHPDDQPTWAAGARHAEAGVTEDGYLRLYPEDEDLDLDEAHAMSAREIADAEGRTLPGYSVNFKERRGTKYFLALLLMVFLSATAIAAYAAVRDDTSTARGIALTMGITSALVWAGWAATPVAKLSIIGGMLEVHRDGAKHIIALVSPYTEIESYRRPSHPGWRMVFRRSGQAVLTVDASMVNPKKFLSVVRAYRPEV